LSLRNAKYLSQSELCKPNVRGRLVTTEVLFTGLGVTIAYFFSYGMSYASGALAWRLPIAMQIPPTFIIIILVVGLPESPRWLVQKDRISEAVEILSHVFNVDTNDESVQSEKNAMISAVALEQSNPFRWTNAFGTDSVRTGYRIFLACLVLFMNQAGFLLGFDSHKLSKRQTNKRYNTSVGWNQCDRFLRPYCDGTKRGSHE
jgi:MFS family permease